MSAWIDNLMFGLRRLWRTPAFALTATLLLALTIAITSGLSALLFNILYRPLPYVDPTRLVTLQVHLIKEHEDSLEIPADSVKSLSGHPELFQRLGAMSDNLEWLFDSPGSEPTELPIMFMEPDVFSLLQLQPLVGRLPNEIDARATSPRRLLVSENFARQRFGSPAAALNQTLLLRSGSYQVIGVLATSSLYKKTALWLPVRYTTEAVAASAGMRYHGATMVGRLAPGISTDEASRRLTAALDNDPDVFGTLWAHDLQMAAVPLRAMWNFPSLTNLLLGLLGASVALWLITLTNVSNLYLARLAARQHESALMQAIGASPARVLGLQIQDAVTIAGSALLVALLLLPLLFQQISNMNMDLASPWPMRLDLPCVIIASILAVGVAIALILSASWMHYRQRRGSGTLQVSGAHQSAARDIQRVRTGLTVFQVALTTLLLSVSGVLLHSAHGLVHASLGIDRQQLLMTGLSMEADPATFDKVVTRFADLVKGMPAVRESTKTSCNPVSGFGIGPTAYRADGAQDQDLAHWSLALWCSDTQSNFFAFMRVPLVQGRSFTDEEARTHAPMAIVDSGFVERNFPDGRALGKTIRINGALDLPADANPAKTFTDLTIVGVAAPVHKVFSLLGKDPQDPYIYTPGNMGAEVLMRTSGSLGSLRQDLKQLAHQADPKAMLGYTQFADDQVELVARNVYPANRLLAALSVFTLILASLGLYAVLAYATQMRSKEFAIRVALGQSPGALQRSVILTGLRWSAIGMALALPLLWLVGKVLVDRLYRVGIFDPLTMTIVILVVATATLTATWWPARRVARADPMSSLRAQ